MPLPGPLDLLLFWLAFLLAFVLYILLFAWPQERKTRWAHWCPQCQAPRRWKYCQTCGERLEIRRGEERPRCWHCGWRFEERTASTYCPSCGFNQTGKSP
ncbi:MAG: hypothetical protein HY558_00465 [Euryarchaeota archaeon]|nr:hypothetical protein [Euryarchaeota archaeon]